MTGPSRAVADTSVFVAREAGRPLGRLPDEVAVSVVTVGELELGVLRASDGGARARRLATLTQVRSAYELLTVDDLTASCYAALVDEAFRGGRHVKQNDAWIAATAMRHGAAVVTQDRHFGSFASVPVITV